MLSLSVVAAAEAVVIRPRIPAAVVAAEKLLKQDSLYLAMCQLLSAAQETLELTTYLFQRPEHPEVILHLAT